MREIRPSGSVRGVRRNPYPYRDAHPADAEGSAGFGMLIRRGTRTGIPTLERHTALMTKRFLQEQELEQRARKLGVDIQGQPRTGSSSSPRPRAEDRELQ